MKIIAISALAAALALTACATKNYPIATPLSAAEAAAMDCAAIRLEIIRAEQVQKQIADTASPDWRSAAGFLGDFGIGNAMARSDADKALSARVAGLRTAQAQKQCRA